jgi:hypothetical protein
MGVELEGYVYCKPGPDGATPKAVVEGGAAG